MSKTQYLYLAGTLALFLVLYFGCDTKPPGQQRVEQTRALTTEAVSVDLLIRNAFDSLPPSQSEVIRTLMQQLGSTGVTDSTKAFTLEQLSGRWFQAGQPAIAGHYAQLLAEQNGSPQAWATAGTTFTFCLQSSRDEQLRSFCQQRALTALENAISLQPDAVEYQVNRAMVYTEMPPEAEPMKGILLLRDLADKHPDSSLPLNALGRLALKTGQADRAIQRLEQALALDANNLTTVCLLAQAWQQAGNATKAQQFAAQCEALSRDN